MLEKHKGNFRVDKLRAILLYEADFNQNNKKLGREMMYLAKDLRAIAKEQYGSRSRLMAIDQSLNKWLTYDIIRQKKRPGVLCSNDAKSCYDRIVHLVVSLAMQELGPQSNLSFVCLRQFRICNIGFVQFLVIQKWGSVVHCMWYRFKAWVKGTETDLKFGQ